MAIVGPSRGNKRAVVLCVVMIAFGIAVDAVFAADGAGSVGSTSVDSVGEVTTPSADGSPDETETLTSAPPAIGAFGVTAGFPSYQTVAVSFSVQSQFVGLQLKGSLTPVGPYFGFQLRGYPPVPFPVPVYVGAGAGFYGPNTTLFAVVGAHVPLSLAMRLDVEGGVAQVPLLEKRQIVPYVSLGVSYAFPLPAAPPPGQVTAIDTVRGDGFGGKVVACAEVTEPDRGALRGAVKRTVREFLDSARATYGSIYTGLRYDYDIVDTSVSGDIGTVEVKYSGSVKTIANGERESASGTATARYRWTGCAWRPAGLRY